MSTRRKHGETRGKEGVTRPWNTRPTVDQYTHLPSRHPGYAPLINRGHSAVPTTRPTPRSGGPGLSRKRAPLSYGRTLDPIGTPPEPDRPPPPRQDPDPTDPKGRTRLTDTGAVDVWTVYGCPDGDPGPLPPRPHRHTSNRPNRRDGDPVRGGVVQQCPFTSSQLLEDRLSGVRGLSGESLEGAAYVDTRTTVSP